MAPTRENADARCLAGGTNVPLSVPVAASFCVGRLVRVLVAALRKAAWIWSWWRHAARRELRVAAPGNGHAI